jgi:hypothetical protein
MNKMFADREHWGSESHYGIMGDLHSAQLTSPSETSSTKQVPTPQISQIREKVTPLFREYFILGLIWLIRG